MQNADNDDVDTSSSNPALSSPQQGETREALLERVLRELARRNDNVRTILLRDRERTDFDHAADLLETQHIHDVLNRNIDNMIERTLIAMPDADADLVRLVAPSLNDMERSRVEQKIEHIRRNLKKKEGGQ